MFILFWPLGYKQWLQTVQNVNRSYVLTLHHVQVIITQKDDTSYSLCHRFKLHKNRTWKNVLLLFEYREKCAKTSRNFFIRSTCIRINNKITFKKALIVTSYPFSGRKCCIDGNWRLQFFNETNTEKENRVKKDYTILTLNFTYKFWV